jgi:hypothetical protein
MIENMENIRAIEDILSSVFSLTNVGLNICMIVLLYKAWNELKSQTATHEILADVLVRMDKLANRNVDYLLEALDSNTVAIITRIDRIHKRQNTTAKMIFDDRERLRQHVERVHELQRIAKALEDRFLKDKATRKKDGDDSEEETHG